MKTNLSRFFYLTFSLTILLSAFLLFQIQPIIGKYILPWFGGTSFVWITSLLFFQIILLGGYFYSFVITKFSIKRQMILHSILVASSASIIVLLFSYWNSPITPDVTIKIPDTHSPVLQVLAVLTLSVGLPYFLLSTTSTLLQKWFSHMPYQKSPYPLYALSNIGSLAAICTYPFLIEPFLSLQNQGQIWSFLFLTLCLLLFLCIVQILRYQKLISSAVKKRTITSTVSKNNLFLWLFLPAVSSIILLSGTHQLTQGIAPIPFLWLLPLGLYLLSFVLCFSEKTYYKSNMYSYTFLLSLPLVLSMIMHPALLGIIAELSFYAVMFFTCFMICHSELYNIRPSSDQLNKYYLFMAAGSVIGSLVVAIIAPLFFVGLFWEFLLGLFLATIIVILIPLRDKYSVFYKRLNSLFLKPKEITYFVIAVVCGFYFIFGIGMLVAERYNTLGIWRNFYGTLRVLKYENGQVNCLLNGKIIHGCQSTISSEKMQPTTYYGERSIGLTIESLRRKHKNNLRIGVLGLGVGTVAAYGKKGDFITFYELNPLDVTIAKTYFTYLKDTPAEVEIVLGDGRLSLEKESVQKKNQHFHLLIIDAFNDDAIPVHLLTKEAFAIYKNHLHENGIIAVHISNSYLDLTPVVTKAAANHHLSVIFIDAPATNTKQTKSRWALLSNDSHLIQNSEFKKMQSKLSQKEINLWTDSYSNLFQIVDLTP